MTAPLTYFNDDSIAAIMHILFPKNEMPLL